MVDDWRNRARRAAHQAGQQRATKDFSAFREEAERGGYRWMTREQLEAVLSPQGTPASMPSARPNSVTWRDTRRGLQMQFTFDQNGTVSGWSLLPLEPPRPIPTALRVWREKVEPLRRWWTGSFRLSAGPVVWAGLLVALMMWRSQRRNLAHAALMVAWVCFLGWFLHPGYHGFVGMFSNDMLFWGVMMMIVSLAVFASVIYGSGNRPDPRFCRACGYDLTGNVSGICSECGTTLADRTAPTRF